MVADVRIIIIRILYQLVHLLAMIYITGVLQVLFIRLALGLQSAYNLFKLMGTPNANPILIEKEE